MTAVAGEELSAVAVEEDKHLDLEAEYPSAYPAAHSYAAVEAGIQADSYPADQVLGIVSVVAG